MYLIVGLGNPGAEYENTRHNMGFKTVNELSKRYNISLNKTKFKGNYATSIIEGEKVILLEPQTYMNLSGESVKPMLDFYKIAPTNLLLIYDDIDVDIGSIKIRKKPPYIRRLSQTGRGEKIRTSDLLVPNQAR